MNGTVVFGGIILFFIISALVNFINDLHDDVDNTYGGTPSSFVHERGSHDHTGVNLYGESTLELSALSENEKKVVWNSSALKQEILNHFPNFTDMKTMIKERVIEDGVFKPTLLKKVETIEEGYISGKETAQSAKTALSSF